MRLFLFSFICVTLAVSCVTPPSSDGAGETGGTSSGGADSAGTVGSGRDTDSGKTEPSRGQDLLPEVFQEWFGTAVGQNIARVFPLLVNTASSDGSVIEEVEGNTLYLSRGIFPPAPSGEEIELESLGMKLLSRSEMYGRLDRPETLTVAILETEELNSFSSGNGIILITRGLLDCAQTEAQKAAILSHEIAHQAAADPLIPIDPAALAALFGGRVPSEAEFNSAFESDPDIRKAVNEMLMGSLFLVMDSGYGEEAEFRADTQAVTILERGGYKRRTYTDLLRNIEAVYNPQRPDMAVTHPAPGARLAKLGVK
jgi:hypothetical protein